MIRLPWGMGPSLVTDLVTSIVAALACGAVFLWIARTNGRTFLERRSLPLLATLGAVFAMRPAAWLSPPGSALRVLEDVIGALHPLSMALFVEALLRRHLPRHGKWTIVAATAVNLLVALLPDAFVADVALVSCPS